MAENLWTELAHCLTDLQQSRKARKTAGLVSLLRALASNLQAKLGIAGCGQVIRMISEAGPSHSPFVHSQ